MRIALTRQVSRSIVNCELSFLNREPIDIDRARLQHMEYESALRGHGLAVLSLPEEPDLPDSVFVEDTALVLHECAIITRPGAASRRPETESIARMLGPYRELRHIEAPARADGGDFLLLGKRLYMGVTQRSDSAAFKQMQDMLEPLGYEVRAVTIAGCLHLKSAVTAVAPETILCNPAWVDGSLFGGVKTIHTDPSEPHAANALWLGDTILFPSAYSRTRDRLEREGLSTTPVPADELAKAEGGLTCCSLIFNI